MIFKVKNMSASALVQLLTIYGSPSDIVEFVQGKDLKTFLVDCLDVGWVKRVMMTVCLSNATVLEICFNRLVGEYLSGISNNRNDYEDSCAYLNDSDEETVIKILAYVEYINVEKQLHDTYLRGVKALFEVED